MTYKLTWLADVLRKAGLKVVEQAEWQTRGHGDVGTIKGILCHHTAGGLKGNAPSLNVVQNGRSDLSGPLSQLVLGRDGTYFVVAAGLCYHAGAGNWHGITNGNSALIGIEAENTGLANDPWPEVQKDAYRRGCAAILTYLKAPAIMCAGHREYALPKGRKPDPSFDMIAFRAGIEALMGGAIPAPPPPPKPLTPGDAQLGIVAMSGLNLREKADAKAPIITVLVKDQKVSIVDEELNGDTKWYRVWLRDPTKVERRGWVAARYITTKGDV